MYCALFFITCSSLSVQITMSSENDIPWRLLPDFIWQPGLHARRGSELIPDVIPPHLEPICHTSPLSHCPFFTYFSWFLHTVPELLYWELAPIHMLSLFPSAFLFSFHQNSQGKHHMFSVLSLHPVSSMRVFAHLYLPMPYFRANGDLRIGPSCLGSPARTTWPVSASSKAARHKITKIKHHTKRI